MKRLIAIMLTLVLTLSGCSNQEVKQKETQTIEKNYDVVVVGGGAAGLAAAIEAAEAGASVALIEKLPMLGGSTVLSGGIVYSTGSQIQKDNGIEDSVEDLVTYWNERAEGKSDEAYLRFVAEKSGATLDWLVGLGVEFGAPHTTGTSPVLRAVSALEHGSGIINPMKEYALSKNVEILLQTTAQELIVNEAKQVAGVKAIDKEGNTINFNAGAVVLATGGFDRNSELVKTYAPIAEGQMSFAGVGNTGDGLTMAKSVGAMVESNGGVIGFRAVEGEPAYTTEICMLMWMPYLYVNQEGQRFVNESIDYPLFYEELVKQTEGVSYLIFDGNTYNPVLDKAVEKGSAFVAESLEDLAKQANIDVTGLKETVASYNEMIQMGKDTAFGKDLTGHMPIEKGKFYALKIVPATLGTLSGIKTDLNAQVLNASGDVIPGLFAAGEVANSDFYYKIYPASGTSIQMCLTFGRVAGEKAADFVK